MKKLILLASLYTSNVNAQNVPSYIDTTGLTAWYSFDNGNLVSAAKNWWGGYDTAKGTATFRKDRNNIANNSAYTNGAAKSYFDLNYCYVKNTTELTISLWAKLDNNAFAVKNAYMLSDWGTGFNLAIGCDNDSNYFMYRNNRISTTGINDTNWHNFIAIISNDSISLYIDNTLKNKQIRDIFSSSTIYAGKFIIGFALTDGSPSIKDSKATINYDGRIDDIAVWSRAISRSEVTKLYEAIDTTTSVSSIKNGVRLNIYPNPANNIITVSSSETINKIEIIDLLGQIVYSINCNDKRVNINVSMLNTGQYFMRVNDYIVRRFTKQ